MLIHLDEVHAVSPIEEANEEHEDCYDQAEDRQSNAVGCNAEPDAEAGHAHSSCLAGVLGMACTG